MDTRPLWLLLAALLAKSNGEEANPAFIITPSLSTLKEVVKEVPGAECRRQVAVVLEGIRNLTDWALQMADATAKVPSGLLRGNLRALGDMDECVAVEAEVYNTTLHGKYCLASFHMDSDSVSVARLLDIATAGRRHLEFRHRQYDVGNGVVVPSPGFVPELSRGEWGVCVPTACSAAKVEAALRGLARRLLPSSGLSLDVRVPPLACRTRSGPARPLRAPHYAFA
ncbi:Uncharacterized protein GBIM_00597 [Gryllus bimaculatus]|nr:Uncharacterized protein GBIM_00597 [Gryllus bimaculatus]